MLFLTVTFLMQTFGDEVTWVKHLDVPPRFGKRSRCLLSHLATPDGNCNNTATHSGPFTILLD